MQAAELDRAQALLNQIKVAYQEKQAEQGHEIGEMDGAYLPFADFVQLFNNNFSVDDLQEQADRIGELGDSLWFLKKLICNRNPDTGENLSLVGWGVGQVEPTLLHLFFMELEQEDFFSVTDLLDFVGNDPRELGLQMLMNISPEDRLLLCLFVELASDYFFNAIDNPEALCIKDILLLDVESKQSLSLLVVTIKNAVDQLHVVNVGEMQAILEGVQNDFDSLMGHLLAFVDQDPDPVAGARGGLYHQVLDFVLGYDQNHLINWDLQDPEENEEMGIDAPPVDDPQLPMDEAPVAGVVLPFMVLALGPDAPADQNPHAAN